MRAFRNGLATSTLGLALAATATAAPTPYYLTPLGDFDGGDFRSNAEGLNDHGQIVGAGVGGAGARAFLWTEGAGLQTFADAGLGSAYSSIARGISNGGAIVGTSTVSPGGLENGQAYIWDGVDFIQPFAGDAHIDWSDGYGVSGNGEWFVGWYRRNDRPSGQAIRGWTYHNGVVTELQGPGDNHSVNAKAVNDSGLVAGHWHAPGSMTASVWDAATGTRLADIPGLDGFAFHRSSSINAAGTVVGTSSHDLDFTDRRPWLWNQGDATVTDLGLLAGYESMAVNGLSDDGSMVIGTAFNDAVGDGVGALWIDGEGWYDINSLIDDAMGYTVFALRGLNDDGWIIGDAINADGFTEAVLLRVVPAPGALLMLGAGCGLAAGAGRRRRK